MYWTSRVLTRSSTGTRVDPLRKSGLGVARWMRNRSTAVRITPLTRPKPPPKNRSAHWVMVILTMPDTARAINQTAIRATVKMMR